MTTCKDGIRIGKGLGDISEETLRFFRQIGVESVWMPSRFVERKGTPPTVRPLVPPTQRKPLGDQPPAWHHQELQRIRDRIEAFGLIPEAMNLPVSGRIVMGHPGADDDLKTIRECIRTAARVGVRVLTYNFTALRASEGYGALRGEGRGGADLRDFDVERIRDLPSLESVGEHSFDAMWGRLEAFLKGVVPAAEEAGLRLALHPNDPPVPVYRGVAQPVHSLAGMKRLVETVDSPSNTLFLDTGVLTELGEDAAQAIRDFGGRDRIGIVHFRNVRSVAVGERYVETFLDDGACDTAACMRAFHEVGYDGLIDPDHTPGIVDDVQDTRIGWAFAIGQLIALREATRVS